MTDNTHTDDEELRRKLEWALGSDIAAPFSNKSRMVPAKGLRKIERDLQINRIIQFINANYTPKLNTDTNVGVTPTPQAAVQGDMKQRYNESLKQIGDLTPYIDFANELLDLAKQGRINDMRRELVIFCAEQQGAPTKSSGELEDLLVFRAALNGLKRSGVKDTTRFEETWKRQLLSYVATQTTKLQAEAYKIGDIVTNVSGWGAGSNDSTPLNVKSILLQVEWDGAKSTRWLSSKEVKHLEREHKIGEDGE